MYNKQILTGIAIGLAFGLLIAALAWNNPGPALVEWCTLLEKTKEQR